ncbi:GNAT family N-acetyltransferase [Ornithinibacillus sp. JPR2-1]|uniref:GNAT family N-acetyltransferase n=1 Tax=Ornithinibacillus sp. JPR2-1 TaxID=2094019 RepID=UPI0031D0F0C0
MELTTSKMTDHYAIKILEWKYEKPYDLYNNVLSGDAIIELTSSSYKAILSKDRVVGFYCTGKDAQVPAGNEVGAYERECVDIGLGMHPDLTGKGFGTPFFAYILEDISTTPQCLRLTVADFNKRAIRLYEKFGFVKVRAFHRGEMKFIVMIKEK